MLNRTDLALESAESVRTNGELPKGISIEVERLAGFEITTVSITQEEAAERIGKPKGKYITVEAKNRLDFPDEISERQIKALAKLLRSLINGSESVLVAGLGNDDITPDSLGVRTAKSIFATHHIKENAPEVLGVPTGDVSVLITGVMGKTGIESSDVVKAVCERIKPSCVIAVDALACSNVSHLGKTVQITDTGISPGSGVANARRELSISTLGVKCIAIGIPTVCDLGNGSDLMVTPRTIDKMIFKSSRLLSASINRALHPHLSSKELEILTEQK